MKKQKDDSESVRISTRLVDRARAVSEKTGPTIRHVLDSVLDKHLPTIPLAPKK